MEWQIWGCLSSPEIAINFHKEMAQILILPASNALSPLIQLMPMTWWENLHSQLVKKESHLTWLMDGQLHVFVWGKNRLQMFYPPAFRVTMKE